MAQNRSADPWSTFLGPAEQPSGTPGARWAEASERVAGDRPAGHSAPDRPDRELSENCRRVLSALAEETDPVPVERLHEVLGMPLLEVADSVRDLNRAGLVEVIRSGMDDLVGPSDAGRLQAGRSGGGRPQ